MLKRSFSLLLCLVMLLSLAACGKKEAAEWSRTGYFSDGENLVTITKSEDEDHPGWLVGAMVEEGNYGWYIQQEGSELKGNLTADYQTDEKPFNVTIAEEGSDGITMTLESGKTYSLKPFEVPEAKYSITINTRGDGSIAYAKDGEEIVFDDEYPSTSAYIGVEDTEPVTIAAKPDEGNKFWKWTKNGEDFSFESTVTFDIDESAEYIAVFGIKGTDETHVDLDKVTSLGQVLGLPDYGSATNEGKYIYVFEQDWTFYRAIASIDDATVSAIVDLEFDDPEYSAKLAALLKDLPVEKVENVTEKELTKDQIASLIGKTGKDLVDAGWRTFGWNFQDMIFTFDYNCFTYEVTMEGTPVNTEDPDDTTVYPLTVKAIKCTGLGSASDM